MTAATADATLATIRAGWTPRLIKGRITRELKASRVDSTFTPPQRAMVAAQVIGAQPIFAAGSQPDITDDFGFRIRCNPGRNDNLLIFSPCRESRRKPDPALPRDRSKALRLHPWRLDSDSLRLLQR